MPALELVALSFLAPRCGRHIGDRLRRGEDPGSLLERLCRLHSDLRGPARRSTPAALRARALAASRRAAQAGIGLVCWGDPSYPPQLAAIADPPPVLWLRGSHEALGGPAVAVVGSRAGSPYALLVAERLAADLAARGVVVVSGLARGVDSAAHRGALAGRGATVAVLGSGPDVIYPPEHAGLADEITARGALVSELAPGTPPRRHFFPWRNRLISGLARAVVVVEAGHKSGSLITARTALDQGRDVLAVPGSVLGGRNRGGHALLRDGAKIVETADDIFEELGLPERPAGRPPGADPARGQPLDPVLATWARGEVRDVDEIVEQSGVPLERLLPRLLELELRGTVRRAGGGRFVRLSVDTRA